MALLVTNPDAPELDDETAVRGAGCRTWRTSPTCTRRACCSRPGRSPIRKGRLRRRPDPERRSRGDARAERAGSGGRGGRSSPSRRSPWLVPAGALSLSSTFFPRSIADVTGREHVSNSRLVYSTGDGDRRSRRDETPQPELAERRRRPHLPRQGRARREGGQRRPRPAAPRPRRRREGSEETLRLRRNREGWRRRDPGRPAREDRSTARGAGLHGQARRRLTTGPRKSVIMGRWLPGSVSSPSTSAAPT